MRGGRRFDSAAVFTSRRSAAWLAGSRLSCLLGMRGDLASEVGRVHFLAGLDDGTAHRAGAGEHLEQLVAFSPADRPLQRGEIFREARQHLQDGVAVVQAHVTPHGRVGSGEAGEVADEQAIADQRHRSPGVVTVEDAVFGELVVAGGNRFGQREHAIVAHYVNQSVGDQVRAQSEAVLPTSRPDFLAFEVEADQFLVLLADAVQVLAQQDRRVLRGTELVRLEPISVGELLSASSLSEGALLALRELESTGQAIVLGSSIGASIGAEHHAVDSRALVASHSWWSAAIVRITELLTDHHRQYPLRGGMPREALRSALKIDARPFNALMTRAVDEMLLVDEGAFVRLPDHEIRLTDDQQARVSALLTRFHQQPYTPPSMKEATAEIGDDVLSVLVSRRELKQLSPEVLLLPDVYDQMQTRVVEYIRQNGSITLAQVRDLFQTSRKYAQALIEYMDAEGITRRVGDERILR